MIGGSVAGSASEDGPRKTLRANCNSHLAGPPVACKTIRDLIFVPCRGQGSSFSSIFTSKQLPPQQSLLMCSSRLERLACVRAGAICRGARNCRAGADCSDAAARRGPGGRHVPHAPRRSPLWYFPAPFEPDDVHLPKTFRCLLSTAGLPRSPHTSKRLGFQLVTEHESCRVSNRLGDCTGVPAAAMGETRSAVKEFAEAAEVLRAAFSPEFEAIGEVRLAVIHRDFAVECSNVMPVQCCLRHLV